MDRSARIFVAGHQGLVGSALVRRLQAENCASLITRARDDLDLTDAHAVDSFFEAERPEYVFLAAARVGGILANTAYPVDFLRDNLLIEANVIHAAYRSGVRKLLFLGSSCIYPKHAPQPMKEEHLLTGPLEPTNEWYAVAKIAGIKLCQAYRRQYGFNAISLMPTNLYGPGDNYDLLSSHVLPALLRKFHLARLAEQQKWGEVEADERRFGPIPADLRASLGVPPAPAVAPRVTLWGTGTPRREFLHVDDLADAALFLMDRYDSEEIVNVGVGEDVTIRELAELAAEMTGFRGGVAWDASKPDGTPRKLLDVGRLHGLGWKEGIGLRQGLSLAYEWYLSQTA